MITFKPKGSAPVLIVAILAIIVIGLVIFASTSRQKEIVVQNQALYPAVANDAGPLSERDTRAYYLDANIDQGIVCGLKVFSPLPGQKVSFPLEVSGYVNGCNWVPNQGQAIRLEVRDGYGLLAPLLIIPTENADNFTLPAYFKATVSLLENPTTPNGLLIFHNIENNDIISESFQIPITF